MNNALNENFSFRALALNCNAPFNDKKGGEATDWKAGKPVRVVRNYKLKKYSKYAPSEGNRYDGIYKVVKYYPEKGKSGFLVWRYLLRRDDPSLPPWHKRAKILPVTVIFFFSKCFDVITLFVFIQYPDGYEEAQKEKEKELLEKQAQKKRRISSTPNTPEQKSKKPKLSPHKLDADTDRLIKADTDNQKLWTQCKQSLKEGKSKFLQTVEDAFRCICCLEVVYLPVTTPCKHIICKSCLERSFSAEIFTCPCCRYELGKEFKFCVNQNLASALLKLFPGYEKGR